MSLPIYLSLHVDLFFAEPSVCFLSSDTALTFTMTDFELQWSALYSNSLNTHFAGNAVSHHATHFGHRYNFIPVASSTVNLAVASNSTNVSGILTFFRDQTSNVSDITQNKLELCSAVNPSDVDQVRFRIAAKDIYDEPLTDANQFYEQLHHMYPMISYSRHYTPAGLDANQWVLATNLSGAPVQFTENLVSGVQSANLNSDMHLQIKFTSPTSTQLQCDHWVKSDVVYTFHRGRISVDY